MVHPYEFYWKSDDGLKFYACAWQVDGEPRAVVGFVHGLGEHCRRYDHVARHLNEAGIAMVAFDHRGHGRTEGKRGHIAKYELLFDDVTRLLVEIDRLYPKAPKILYGHSLGGNIVLNYALRMQPALSGMIATSPELRLAFKPSQAKVLFGKILYYLAPGLTLQNGLNVEGISRDPNVIRSYTQDPLIHDWISVRLGLDMLRNGEWALAHAGELSLPLLLIHGSADQLTSAIASQEFASRAGERCVWKLWEGGYHELHNEPDREQFLDFITDWILSRVSLGPTTG